MRQSQPTTLSRARGFTMIELLVVIAIIAILAAILFPVLAAAKAAAKGAVTLSNLAQLGTSLQLYMNDYDDTVVLSGAWNTGNDVATLSPDTVSTWPWLLNPYLKNGAVMLDALAPANGGIVAGSSDIAQDMFFPQFGMNYVYLTPYDPVGMQQHPVASSMIDKPAETVFATSKYSFSESKIATNGYPLVASPPSSTTPELYPCLWTVVEVPDCTTANSDNLHYCKANWGADDGYINDPSVIGLTTAPAGANTGGVSLRNGGGLASVAFMDGHAKKMSPGELAAGTNWSPSIKASQIVTTDPDKYLWDIN